MFANFSLLMASTIASIIFQTPKSMRMARGGVDAVLYLLAWDHVLEAKEDELQDFFDYFYYI